MHAAGKYSFCAIIFFSILIFGVCTENESYMYEDELTPDVYAMKLAARDAAIQRSRQRLNTMTGWEKEKYTLMFELYDDGILDVVPPVEVVRAMQEEEDQRKLSKAAPVKKPDMEEDVYQEIKAGYEKYQEEARNNLENIQDVSEREAYMQTVREELDEWHFRFDGRSEKEIAADRDRYRETMDNMRNSIDEQEQPFFEGSLY